MTNTVKIIQAKALAREVAGRLGSMAHAVGQVQKYPTSPSAQTYKSQAEAEVWTTWAMLKATMQEIADDAE